MKFVMPLQIFNRWSIWSDYDFDTVEECQEYACSNCKNYKGTFCTGRIATIYDPENHEISVNCWYFEIDKKRESIRDFFSNQKFLPGMYDYTSIQTKNFVVFIWKRQKGKVVLKFDKKGKSFIYYQSSGNKYECMTESLEQAFSETDCNNFNLHKENINLYKMSR